MAATAWYIASIGYSTVWTRPDTLATVVVDQNRLEPGHALLLSVKVSVAAGVPITTGSYMTVTLRQRNGNAKQAVATYVSSAPGNVTHNFRWDADDDLTYVEAPYTTAIAAPFAKAVLCLAAATAAFNYSAGSYVYNQLNRAVTFTTPGTVLANSATATQFLASSTRMEQGFFASSVMLRAAANSASTVVVGDQIAVELNSAGPVAGFSTATVKAANASAPRTAVSVACNAANPTNWTDATRTLLASAARTSASGSALLNQNFFKPTFTFKTSPALLQLPYNGSTLAADNDFTGVYNAAARTIDLNSTTKNLASSLLVGTRIAGPNVDADTFIVAINTTTYANLITINKPLLAGAPTNVSFAPALYSNSGLAAGATQFRAQAGLQYVGVGAPILRVNGVQYADVAPRIYVTAVDANVITLSAPLSATTSFATLLIELEFVNIGRYDPYYRLRMMDLFTFNNCGVKNDPFSTNADGTINVYGTNQLFLGIVVDGEGDTQFLQADVAASSATLTNVVGPAVANDTILYSPLLPADSYFEATFTADSNVLKLASGSLANVAPGSMLVNASLPWATKAVASSSYTVTANFTAGKTQFSIINSPFSGDVAGYTAVTVLFGTAPAVGAALSSALLNAGMGTRVVARTGSGGPGSVLTLSTVPFRAAIVTTGATSAFQMASGTRPLIGYVVYSAQTGYVTVNSYPTDTSFGVTPAVAYTPASDAFVANIDANNLFTVTSGARPTVGDYIRSALTGPLTVLTTPTASTFTVAQASTSTPFGPATAVAFTDYTSAFSTMPTRVSTGSADDFRPSVVVGDVLVNSNIITGARVAAVSGTLVTMAAPALSSATSSTVTLATVTMTNAALKTDDNTRVTVPTYVVASTAPASFTANLASTGVFTVTAGARPAVGTALVSNLTAVVTVATTPAANTFTVTPNGGWGTVTGINFTTGYSATLSRAALYAAGDALVAVRSPVGVFTPPNITRDIQIANLAGTTFRYRAACTAGSNLLRGVEGNPAVGDELVNAAYLPAQSVITDVYRDFVADIAAGSPTLALAPAVDALTISVGAVLTHVALPPSAVVTAVDTIARTVTISNNALDTALAATISMTKPAARISHAASASSAGAVDLAVAAGPPMKLATVYGDYIDMLDPAYGVTPPYVIFLQHVFKTGDLTYTVDAAAAARTAQLLTSAFRAPLARTLRPDLSGAAPATYSPFTFLSDYFFNAATGLVSNSTSEPWQYPKILNPDDATAPYIYNFCTLAILNNVVADFLTNPESTTAVTTAYCRGQSTSATAVSEYVSTTNLVRDALRALEASTTATTLQLVVEHDVTRARAAAYSHRTDDSASLATSETTAAATVAASPRSTATIPTERAGSSSWAGLALPKSELDIVLAIQTLFAQLASRGISPADVEPVVTTDTDGNVVAVMP